MPQDVRLWEILDGDSLREIRKARLDLEERVENWLEKDITIVSDDLLVIGRQVGTDFGGAIDILCLDRNGDAVILELKRDKTPREVTAQVLDYASWVQDLSNERLTEIADTYLCDRGPLEEAFSSRFGVELPEILNEHHKMLVVASEIDSSSERIIRYLSDSYGVGINALTFQYFRGEGGRESLTRVFLIEPSQVEYSTQTKAASKRRPPLTYEALQEMAERNGVGELYEPLEEALTDCFDQRTTTMSSIALVGIIAGGRKTIFSLKPGESDSGRGLRFEIYADRLGEYLGVDRNDMVGLLPAAWED
ncbi:MAG: DUF91 domain-containing protein, partial [Deltaproteobacteria bacterium]|nr:DUF91 domain-containing protein [Deltaproteobacteria bacterium]